MSIFGADAQYGVRRLDLRAEVARGARPSTLVGLEPELTPTFAPRRRTTGAALGAIYSVTDADQAYGRLDVLAGDPVTGETAHAVDLGYLRIVDEHSRIGFNWQWKNRPTYNDDAINTR